MEKFVSENGGLVDRISSECHVIPEGSVMVVFSRKNLDNIAKYHILNRISDLYFDGSLPKNGKNQYKFSDFKYETARKMTFHVEYVVEIADETGHGYFKGDSEEIEITSDFRQSTHFNTKQSASDYASEISEQGYDKDAMEVVDVIVSDQLDENGIPVLQFMDNQMGSGVSEDGNGIPPWYVVDREGNPEWFFRLERRSWMDESQWKTIEKGDQKLSDDEAITLKVMNSSSYPVSRNMDFLSGPVVAYKVKSRPEKYLDYLYIANGGLSFKVSEESQSFADAMSRIPPFYIDEVMKNKLRDMNDVQILKEYSTFIH